VSRSIPSVPSVSWLDPRLSVAPSQIHGLGLFARTTIPAGEVVMVLGGDVLSDAEVRDALARGERYDGIALDDDANLRLQPPDWPGIHGNHSCEPNLWLVPPVDVAARLDIRPGEEACSDYATYTLASEWRMSCRCGSSICRGTITGEDWRRPELQRRYEAHFAVSIARRIASGAAPRPETPPA
jgi:hypothetical protein